MVWAVPEVGMDGLWARWVCLGVAFGECVLTWSTCRSCASRAASRSLGGRPICMHCLPQLPQQARPLDMHQVLGQVVLGMLVCECATFLSSRWEGAGLVCFVSTLLLGCAGHGNLSRPWLLTITRFLVPLKLLWLVEAWRMRSGGRDRARRMRTSRAEMPWPSR